MLTNKATDYEIKSDTHIDNDPALALYTATYTATDTHGKATDTNMLTDIAIDPDVHSDTDSDLALALYT